MKKSRDYNSDRLQFLASIYTKASHFKAHLATLSLPSPGFSHHFSTFLLLLEHFQLISQILLTNHKFSVTPNSSELAQGIYSLAKIFSPGHFLDFTSENKLTRGIIIAILCFDLMRFSLVLYACGVAMRKIREYKGLIFFWRVLLRIQGRIFCFMVTSIFFRWINTNKKEFEQHLLFDKNGELALSVFCISLEVFFSVVFQMLFVNILPCKKDLLSAKSNKIETLTLIQKVLLQILEEANDSGSSLSLAWLSPWINIVFCALRTAYFYKYLPIYKTKALELQAKLLALVSALNIALLLEIIADQGFSKKLMINTSFGILGWFLMAPLLMKLADSHLNNIVLKLITGDGGLKIESSRNPEILIHKVVLIKEFLKSIQSPKTLPDVYQMKYLIDMNIVGRIYEILGVDKENDLQIIDNKDHFQRIISLYLQKIIDLYPESEYIKLYAAYFNTKKLKIYGLGIKSLLELKESSSPNISWSASLLIDEVEEAIHSHYNKNEGALNISNYLNIVNQVSQIKLKMLEQARIQVKLCNEINQGSPRLMNIFNRAQRIYTWRKKIGKDLRILREKVPDYYVEILLLCAHYSLALNFSLVNYEKYYHQYLLKNRLYEKYFKSDKLCEENLFHRNTGLFITSGGHSKKGTIIYCSKLIEELHGQKCVGLPFKLTTPPVFLEQYAIQNENSIKENQVYEQFGYNTKEKCIFPRYLYMDIYPNLDVGYCTSVLTRQIRSSHQEYIILSEEGFIEGFTQDIGKKLNLIPEEGPVGAGKHHIKQICWELDRINTAYNIVAHPERYNFRDKDKDTTPLSIMRRKYSSKPLNDTYISSNRVDSFISTFIEGVSTSIKAQAQTTLEQAKAIFDFYSCGEAELEFYPLDYTENGGNSRSGSDGSLHSFYVYRCRLENQSDVKILTLEKVITQTGNNLESAQKQRQGRKLVRFKSNSKPTLLAIKPSCSNSDTSAELNMETEEEKKGGWSDFRGLTTSRNITGSRRERSMTINTNRGTLIVDNDVPLSAKQLITSRIIERINMRKKQKELNNQEGASELDISDGDREQQDKMIKKSNMSRDSDHTKRMKVAKAFLDATNKRYYSKTSKALTVGIIVLFLAAICKTIQFSFYMNSSLKNLEARKKLINSAEQISLLLSQVGGRSRILWGFATGLQDPNDYPVARNVTNMIAATQSSIQSLWSAEQVLIQAANSLSHEDTMEVTSTMVEFAETFYDDPEQTSIKITIFQGIHLVVETALRALKTAKSDLEATAHDFAVLIRNCLNDILVENDLLVTEFQRFFHNQTETINVEIFRDMWVVLSLFLSTGIVFISLASIQYKREKENLFVFCKVSRKGVETTIQDIEKFQKAILEERPLEEDLDDEKEGYCYLTLNNKRHHHAVKSPEAAAKAVYLKTPKHEGITRKYQIYVAQFLCIVLVFVSLGVWNAFFQRGYIKAISATLAQLNFVSRLFSAINLQTSVAREIGLFDDRIQVFNMPAIDAYNEKYLAFVKLIEEIPERIKNGSGDYDPNIADIFFGNACAHLDDEVAAANCYKLAQGRESIALMNLITGFKAALINYEAMYKVSNRTEEAITEMLLTIEYTMLPPLLTMQDVFPVVTDYFDQIMNERMEREQGNNNKFSVGFSLWLVFGCLFACVFVIRKVDEEENRFRKVLQSLPSEVILANFILKSYLVRTSHEVLNSIKTDL